jgi:hypothetical protein
VPDLLPSRSWDELVATSIARGRTLRRRRRAAHATAPVLAVSALAAVLVWQPRATGHDSLTVVPALPGPTHAVQVTQQTRPNVQPGAGRAGSGATAVGPTAPQTARDTPVPRNDVHFSRSATVPPHRLSFSDVRGDAVPGVGSSGGTAVGPSASDDALDILSVRVESLKTGLSVTMRLAPAHRHDA